LSIKENSTGLLGTIEPGSTKDIAINLQCSASSVQGPYALKTIGVQIKDPINNKTWNDSVSVRFYKEPIYLIVATPYRKSLNGVLIAPDGQIYRLPYSRKSTAVDYDEKWPASARPQRSYNSVRIELPAVLSGNYMLVFCGASAETESAYFVRFFKSSFPEIDSFSDLYPTDMSYWYDYVGWANIEILDNFMDVSRYEPNNTEQTATVPDSDSFFGYLHKNDFDYYKFRLE
jgi:hypothetical protein